MGNVIDFARRLSGHRRPASRQEAQATGPARILLFLGVRYERHADPPADTSGRPRDDARGRRRRRRAT